MTQPTPYTLGYSFTDFSAASPTAQQPGVKLDAEYNAIATTLAGVLTNLALIQRDDGKLANGSVTLDQLAADVLTTIGSGLGWVPRGAWLTATTYAVGDVVEEAGTTYVSTAAHTSGVFATDDAAGKWVAIFGAVTVSVPDGSVTTVKIADGAVTAVKLAITSLDLSGSIRAATGLAAGTEVAGTYAIGAKLAAGSVLVSAARTTRAQGAVGVRLDGGTSGSVWTVQQLISADDLTIASSLSGKTVVVLRDAGGSDWGYTLRVQGETVPATGAGVEISYASNVGYVAARDRGATTWKNLKLQGLVVTLSGGGVDVLSASSTGVAITNPSFTGTPVEDIYVITDAAAFEIDPANGSLQEITLGASRTPKATNFQNGQSVTLAVDDGTAYTLTWTDATFGGSGVKWLGASAAGSAPVLATTGFTWITLWKRGGQVYGSLAGISA